MSVLFTCCRSHTCSCCSSSWCTWWWCNTAAWLQPQAGQVITREWLLRQSSRTWAILLQAACSKKLRNQSPQPPKCSCPNFPKLYRCTSGRVHKALVNMTEKVDGEKVHSLQEKHSSCIRVRDVEQYINPLQISKGLGRNTTTALKWWIECWRSALNLIFKVFSFKFIAHSSFKSLSLFIRDTKLI